MKDMSSDWLINCDLSKRVSTLKLTDEWSHLEINLFDIRTKSVTLSRVLSGTPNLTTRLHADDRSRAKGIA